MSGDGKNPVSESTNNERIFMGVMALILMTLIPIVVFVGLNQNSSVQPDCEFQDLVNDGICDDKANTLKCNFYGGDCCINTDAAAQSNCMLCKCFGTFLHNY
jgi:hypothetical protein